MTSFVTAACCRGKAPEGLAPYNHEDRQDLVSRLMQDRSVVRFIVAPDGFGKTALAYDYADIVRSFDRVCWLKGSSPCFMRDVDGGTLASDIMAAERTAGLAVIDDLPAFEESRAALLSEHMDALLEAGWEVLVCCAPSADVYQGLQPDRVILTGHDLLLEEDRCGIRLRGQQLRCRFPRSERIACLQWSEAGADQILSGLKREEAAGSLRTALAAVLLLGEGESKDLELFLEPGEAHRVAEELEARYPQAGFDGREGVFCAAYVEPADAARILGTAFDRMAALSLCGDRDGFARCLADRLLEGGRPRRAASVMEAMASRRALERWLSARGWDLLLGGDAESVCRIYDLLESGKHSMAGEAKAWACWASQILDDEPRALSLGRRVLRRCEPGTIAHSHGCALMLRLASGEEQSRVAEAARAVYGPHAAAFFSSAVAEGSGAAEGRVAARLALAAAEDDDGGLRAWLEGARSATGHGACALVRGLLMAAPWVIGECCGIPSLRAEDRREAMGSLARAVVAFADGATAPATWMEAAAVASLSRLRAQKGSWGLPAPSPETVIRCRRTEAHLEAQRGSYCRRALESDRAVDDFRRTHPDEFRNERRTPRMTGRSDRRIIPVLHVDLLGSLRVSVGNEPVPPSALSRRRAHRMLALLAINSGRELMREDVMALLWPGSSPNAARKNYYTAWSVLTKALQVGSSCPYLVRTAEGCRLDPSLLDCDIDRLEGFCRSLLFDKGAAGVWESLYQQAATEFGQDLLPGERGCPPVDDARSRYRVQITDALAAMARRLLEEGQTAGALWFAREAIRRDPLREDAYGALMAAQMESGQRAGAIDTYFACKKMLAEELGLDPSPALDGLYRALIQEEAPPAAPRANAQPVRAV